MLRKLAVMLAGVTLAATLTAGAFAADKPTIGVVVKIGGIPWFNAMEQASRKTAPRLGVKASWSGPTSADPALQVRAIEDLIAKKVNVIGVVPNDAKVLEPVLEKARQAGIKVITHEGPGRRTTTGTSNSPRRKGFGEASRELLAQKHGRQGRIRRVRRLADRAAAQRLGGRRHRLHQGQVSRHEAGRRPLRRRRERRRQPQDRARPHARASRPQGLPRLRQPGSDRRGARSRGEALEGKVVVMGPFSPGQGRKLVHEGVITGGFMWNPEQAGEVFVTSARCSPRASRSRTATKIPGLGVVHPDTQKPQYHHRQSGRPSTRKPSTSSQKLACRKQTR